MFTDSHLTVTETRGRLVRPDVAAVDVKWTMTGARDPHGNPWPIDLPSPDLAKAQAALSKN